jgi:hypothetical protein
VVASGEMIVCQTFARDCGQCFLKAFGVGKLAFAVPERFFIQVAEQMKGLDADIGTVKPVLQKRPEVFQGVGPCRR